MSALTLARPWLEFDLAAPHRVLSWALNRPGFVTADRIVWREVRDADLTPDLDVNAWFARELGARGLGEAVGLLTSRDVRCHHRRMAHRDGVTAEAVATVGLSNAERIGTRQQQPAGGWGTINIALRLDLPLAHSGLIEAMSLAVQARTAAVMEACHILPTGVATGTGTDCVAIAAPPGAAPYAGLHTAVGEAAGRAVFDAVAAGVREWLTCEGAEPTGPPDAR